MPRRLMLLVAVISLAFAIPACHNNSGGNVVTTPTPSLTPNPSITAATVNVTILGSPAADIPVEESTPTSTSSPRPGTPFVTKRTHKDGSVKFQDLKPTAIYCWVAILGPNQRSSQCASWEVWQYLPITLGT
ncbi:MAG: hypothetical protein JOZ01_02630 [Candidatus Eremiobacteraeota bacterium]|nr:hypothetical protein [Candidatus Eremiobacteraeota bacterium]